MPNSAYVIAISGPSGAGKTTAIAKLVELLGEAASLGIDQYVGNVIYPPTLEWLKRGANPDEFVTPRFVADVRALKAGRAIAHPEDERQIGPTRYIVVEEPFGRSRTAMRPLIDFHAQIALPLEIALARRVRRIVGGTNQGHDEDRLTEFLEWYLRAGRDFYTAVRDRAAQDCDLTVDGTLPTESIAQTIFDAVAARQSL